MPYLTLEQVAAELGLKSVQSVRNIAARGELTIVHLQASAAPRRIRVTYTKDTHGKPIEPKTRVRTLRGSPRVDSAVLEAYKARLAARAGAAPAPAESPAGVRPPRPRKAKERLPAGFVEWRRAKTRAQVLERG